MMKNLNSTQTHSPLRRKTLKVLGLAMSAPSLLGQTKAWSQSQYPDRAIRLVVPFAPGGSTDILGRRIAQRLTSILGVSVVVDNRAGAAGAIGCTEVAHSTPDGYTLLLGTTGTHAINPFTMINPTYDAVKDFNPIALLGTQPFSLAVHPSLGVNNLSDLVNLAKQQPGKLSYASAGAGGIAHLTAELFKQIAGNLDIVHIPYKGGGPAIQDVLAGHVPIISDSFSTTYPYHRQGKLKVLAMTASTRSKSAPDVPTAIEQGFVNFTSATAGILLAPSKTPKPVIETVYRAVEKSLADNTFLKELEAISIDPSPGFTADKTLQFIKAEMSKWGPVVKETGTKME
jgi:tripartite-type tricarboxylate transporter receptor subunit TctC